MTVTAGAANVFSWFQTLTTITSLITWINILIAYVRFHAACKAQGVDRNTLPMKSWVWYHMNRTSTRVDETFANHLAQGQPYVAYVTLAFFSIIVFFNGFYVFTNGNWDVKNFVTAYICVPIYFAFYLFWKIVKRTPFVKASEADIWSGKVGYLLLPLFYTTSSHDT
jgi:yeast amino acid transporter